jgi:hypothetical protein
MRSLSKHDEKCVTIRWNTAPCRSKLQASPPPGATSRTIIRFPEPAVQVEQFAGYLAKGPGIKALGITVPPSLLAMADALIE